MNVYVTRFNFKTGSPLNYIAVVNNCQFINFPGRVASIHTFNQIPNRFSLLQVEIFFELIFCEDV